MDQTPIYVPPHGLHTYLDNFRGFMAAQHMASLSSYQDLHQFSIERPNDFWMGLWKFLDIKASIQPSFAVDEALRIDDFPQFFHGSRLNYAENLLRTRGSGIALKSLDETSLQEPESVTWEDMRERVRQVTDAMRSSGVGIGDVVIVIGSNSTKSVVLLLATAALGATFCSFSMDLGEKALHDRLTQLKPRLVFAQMEYSYNGKKHQIFQKILTVFSTITKAPNAELICSYDNFIKKDDKRELWATLVPWRDFVNRGSGRRLTFQQVPFNHPLVVMFSSGTTGAPKGIVHSHGGLIINGMKENHLHNNFGPSDVYFHFTNYSQQVTAFGAGPRYFEELCRANIEPKQFAQNLQLILSTGAVLTTSLSKWISRSFGAVCQISMSGGTELCGSFVHGTQSMPTWPGQITVKALGLDVDVLSPDGQPVAPGEMGELVCKKPFPNMPVCFLHDPLRKRYFEMYFSSIPHVWTHGDLIKVDPNTGGMIILGRSDGVLNPSGVRFGSSEIYSVLARHFPTQVLDSICVGQQRQDKDTHERVFLFIKRSSSLRGSLSSQLEPQIRNAIARDLSRRHVPHFIVEVDSIPYNSNGKKMETQVKAVLNRGLEALRNLKISDDERTMLKSFSRYFHAEDSTMQSGPYPKFTKLAKI